MTLTFDSVIYGALLAEIAPKVIETEAEYERLLLVTECLTFAKSCTPEEQVLYKLLVKLIEDYEEENYPVAPSKPNEILRHIMEVSGIGQSDLAEIMGLTSDIVCEVINGKRAISAAQAKALAAYFKVMPDLFIEADRKC